MKRLIAGIRPYIREIERHIRRFDIPFETIEHRGGRYHGPGEYTYDSDWEPLNEGEIWGRPGQTVWIRFSIHVPDHWKGLQPVLCIKTGGEGLLRIDGQPWHGIDDNRSYVPLCREAGGGEEFTAEIEIKAGDYWDWAEEEPESHGPGYILRECRLAAVDKRVEAAYYDFAVLLKSAEAVRSEEVGKTILHEIKKSLLKLDFTLAPAPQWVDALTAAAASLRKRVAAVDFGGHPARVDVTGHSHIDLAWLWPLRETIRKCGRTFSTIVSLLEDYPEFHFNCSQIPIFLYIKEHFPHIYGKMKKFISSGRLEPIGATWVEHDTNLLSGESLVRQCLYGQQFLEKEFGARAKVGWLPDVFGYSWALPQIYCKAGIELFVTSKISWNDTNTFPYSTFQWQGVDGTRLPTYFICGAYNGTAEPEEILDIWEAGPTKHTRRMLYSFGYGDGGGGPTREMVEHIRRMDLVPGLPRCRQGKVHDFLADLKSSFDDLDVWNGELYLELHRGTYTTQARTKRGNRKCELTLRDTEFFAAVTGLEDRVYPYEDLTAAWKTVLLHQFHDILPGSSVAAVYRDTHKAHEEVLKTAAELRDAAVQKYSDSFNTQGPGTPVLVINSLSFERSELVSVDSAKFGPGTVQVLDCEGREMAVAREGKQIFFRAENLPPMGASLFRIHADAASSKGESVDTAGSSELCSFNNGCIDTPFYSAKMEADGSFTSLIDKRSSREIVADGRKLNELLFFEDWPEKWEAWEIDPHYEERTKRAEVRKALGIDEQCLTHLRLSYTLEFGESLIESRITFYADSPRIDIHQHVHWKASKVLLKAAFPLALHSQKATYEIQYGTIERPTHRNTSWDRAKFEVSGYRWADISEGDFGVSIINDCKYGWDCRDNVLRLSLLRATKHPDTAADLGEHDHAYAIFPHPGDWRNGTVHNAAAFNSPVISRILEPHDGLRRGRHCIFSTNKSNVIIDAVKRAEADDGLVVRLYEAHGSRTPVQLYFDRDYTDAWECNLLEDRLTQLKTDSRSIGLYFGPYEVKTLLLSDT